MPSERGSSGSAVAGLLLAAGTSSRMGRNKLLLEIEGETVLRRAARTALAGGLAPVVVVLGHEIERARAELRDLDVRAVTNPDYATGIATSVRAGVAALPAAVDAAMVLLADMVFVRAEMIAGLVARYRERRPPLVISDYEGVNAPPMLYDRSLFGELASMSDGRCGQQVVKRHRSEAEVLAWPAAALADLDLPADLERLGVAASSG